MKATNRPECWAFIHRYRELGMGTASRRRQISTKADNFHVPDSELFSCDQVPDWMVLNPLRWAKRQIIIARDQRDLNVPQDETIRG